MRVFAVLFLLLIGTVILVDFMTGQTLRTRAMVPVSFIQTAAGEEPAPACVSEDWLLEKVKTSQPDATHDVFTAARATAYVKAFDIMPPAGTSPEVDTLIAFTSPSRPQVYVNGFRHGCRVMAGLLRPDWHKAILAKLDDTI